jgi:hypothetical protein
MFPVLVDNFLLIRVLCNRNLNHVSNCMLLPDFVELKCLKLMLYILEIARSLWMLQKIV